MQSSVAVRAVLACVAVLTYAATFGRAALGPHAAPLLFLAAGIGLSCAIPFLPRLDARPLRPTLRNPWAWVAAGMGVMLSYALSARILDAAPLRYQDADMVPILQVMARRFLSGDWRGIYDPVPEIWSGVQPIYLPFLWLPFGASELLRVDPRWVTVCGIWVAAGVVMAFVDLRRGLTGWLVLGLLCGLMLYLHLEPSHNVIRLTEEGVVYAWYALLAWALVSRSDWLLGLTLTACLLSRYSLAGAVPAILLYRALQGRWRSLLTLAAIPASFVVLMVAAFGMRAVMPFTSLPGKYVGHARWVWATNPEYMTQGLGLAKYFGPERVDLQHSVLLVVSLLGPSVAAVLLHGLERWRRAELPQVEPALVVMALTGFHALVVVPYDYLFFTPVFFALVLAAMVQSRRLPGA
jgi:hypothetical protein